MVVGEGIARRDREEKTAAEDFLANSPLGCIKFIIYLNMDNDVVCCDLCACPTTTAGRTRCQPCGLLVYWADYMRAQEYVKGPSLPGNEYAYVHWVVRPQVVKQINALESFGSIALPEAVTLLRYRDQ